LKELPTPGGSRYENICVEEDSPWKEQAPIGGFFTGVFSLQIRHTETCELADQQEILIEG